MNQIRELKKEANKLKPAIRSRDVAEYASLRDNVIISFLPHATNTTKMAEKSWYKQAIESNNSYLESVLYADIWGDLLPGERLGIEHLYYDNPALVNKDTGFYKTIHDYISAKRDDDTDLAKQHLTDTLWEVLHNSLPDKSTITSSLPELYYEKTQRRRKAQADMLNSLNVSTYRLPTSDYIIESIRRHYQSANLENLLTEIVFPLEENARSIAEEIGQINAEMQQQILGQKSIVSDSATKPEATSAFVELTTKIMEDVRQKINTEIEEQAKQGKTEKEIIERVTQTIQGYQDTTVPQKMDMLATHFNGKLSELEQREAGYEYYIWRTQDDEKVRHDHARYDDLIFRWNNPPPVGHPGEDYNCRCWPEPISREDITGNHRFYYVEDHPIQGIDNVYPELILIPVARGAKIVAEGLKKIGQAVLKVFRRKPDDIAEDIARSRGKIEKAKDSIEEYLGGKGKIVTNKDGDTVITRGNRKVRFDINNPKPHKEPHFHLERKTPSGRWRSEGGQRYDFKKEGKE